jgi:hypothetical protein
MTVKIIKLKQIIHKTHYQIVAYKKVRNNQKEKFSNKATKV